MMWAERTTGHWGALSRDLRIVSQDGGHRRQMEGWLHCTLYKYVYTGSVSQWTLSTHVGPGCGAEGVVHMIRIS